ncbi:hypothetical protein ACMZOO_10860 [Catenovulum sp. SX2]|uniref:hypothetical protein n=1 Tax=Catenovulum sp. SX2 TaxID=3398614 RepID=UPI003F84391A
MKKNNRNGLLVAGLISVLSACGGGGSSSTPDQPNGGGSNGGSNKVKLVGVLTDSPINNISYQTSSGLSGKTNQSGEFNYHADDSITFSLGSIEFPDIQAQALLTPLELMETRDVNAVKVVNLLRLLQTLDNDNQPNNGIDISETTIAAIEQAQINFQDFDTPITNFAQLSQIDSVLATFEGGKSLIEQQAAIEHFVGTLASFDDFDLDMDGIPNNQDDDDDGDGVADTLDLFPLQYSESTDFDQDGIGDFTDTDDDNDGIDDDSDSVTRMLIEWENSSSNLSNTWLDTRLKHYLL